MASELIGGRTEVRPPREVGRRRVLVTGAAGFVGRCVLDALRLHGIDGVAGVRDARTWLGPEPAVSLGDIFGDTDFSAGLVGCSGVIHCAGRAHILKETAPDPEAEFLRINVEASVSLAKQAAASGVARFVFVSSIGVNGPSSVKPFAAVDCPAPSGPYARSKLMAEQRLRCIASSTGLELVVVRPVLVYGPGCRGNFERLMRLVSMGIPLPLDNIDGTRSLISVWNLADILVRCTESSSAIGRTFVAADGQDVSLPELLRSLGNGMGRPVRLWGLPPKALAGLARLVGVRDPYQKLTSRLTVDVAETKEVLAWEPPMTFDEGIRLTAAAYAKSVVNRR